MKLTSVFEYKETLLRLLKLRMDLEHDVLPVNKKFTTKILKLQKGYIDQAFFE